ncbi:MAG: protein phosphatase 2C domain-containing protein [Pseudomonadota bacterium]
MRDHQEDAVVSDFPLGSDFGVAVLADGMGGHAAGDVASKIVMTEVYSELKFQSAAPEVLAANMVSVLHGAAESANACLRAHVQENPEAAGMGATLVAVVLNGSRMHWISVGDSPLYLFRNGQLRQLNEDHSMAPQIDFMVNSGLMDSEIGRDHPDRNCLTSVLAGDEIVRIDCPLDPFVLQNGDIVLVSSDGLQFLEHDEIAQTLGTLKDKPATDIASRLLAALEELADPDQDNVSMAVIKVALDETTSGRVATRPLGRRSAVSDMPQRLHLSEVSVRPRRQQGRLTDSRIYKAADGQS